MAVSFDSILKLPIPHKIGILVVISVFILGGYWQGIHRSKMKGIIAKESKLADLTRDMKEKENIAARVLGEIMMLKDPSGVSQALLAQDNPTTEPIIKNTMESINSFFITKLLTKMFSDNFLQLHRRTAYYRARPPITHNDKKTKMNNQDFSF